MLVLINFAFIGVFLSNFFHCLAFLGPENFRSRLWPFTDVLRRIWRFVMRKNAEDFEPRMRGCHRSGKGGRSEMILAAPRKQTFSTENVRVAALHSPKRASRHTLRTQNNQPPRRSGMAAVVTSRSSSAWF